MRVVVVLVALLDMGALDLNAREPLRLGGHWTQFVAVIEIAAQSLGVWIELTVLKFSPRVATETLQLSS